MKILKVKKNNEKNIKPLHVQRTIFGSCIVEMFYGRFFNVKDNKNVDVKHHQTMKCILCYNNIIFICNLKTQARKDLILSNTINGYNIETTCECNHSNVEEEVKNPLRGKVENNL
jgi:hypothetical protein